MAREELSATGATASLERQMMSLDPVAATTDWIAPVRGSARRHARAQLAPWQAKLAKETMIAQPHRQVALCDVADRLGMTVNHFIKAFRSTVGVAPYHWFMQLRIARSLELLRDDDLTISQVASECGFADQSHFSKAFSRLLGVSPGRWRRRTKVGTLTANEQQIAADLFLLNRAS